MYEHNALGYWSGLTLCLTKVRSSRARCPATALIIQYWEFSLIFSSFFGKLFIDYSSLCMCCIVFRL